MVFALVTATAVCKRLETGCGVRVRKQTGRNIRRYCVEQRDLDGEKYSVFDWYLSLRIRRSDVVCMQCSSRWHLRFKRIKIGEKLRAFHWRLKIPGRAEGTAASAFSPTSQVNRRGKGQFGLPPVRITWRPRQASEGGWILSPQLRHRPY